MVASMPLSTIFNSGLNVPRTAFLLDLDGTLVDSVYVHIAAWQEAFAAENIRVSAWRIHRRTGMSGDLFIDALRREACFSIDEEQVERLLALATDAYRRRSDLVGPLPGTLDLIRHFEEARIPWAIATSGRGPTVDHVLKKIGVDQSKIAVITRDLVKYAKPEPDIFLAAAAALGHPIQNTCVVGDSVWDMIAARRAGALGIGLLCGGYGKDELLEAHALRVFEDPADLLHHIDEIGGRR